LLVQMKRITRNLAALVALCALVTACSRDGRDMSAPSPDQTQSIAIVTTVAEAVGTGTGFSITTPWADGGAIDAMFTCTGGSVSPSITFSNIEPDIVSLAISLVDETSGSAVHWIVANIDVTQPTLSENAVPVGAIQAINVAGTTGYHAPCAPAGQTHTFRLTGYGLPQQLDLPDGTDSTTLINAIELAALDTVSNTFVVAG
jgi:Raf kinase inhibitor-like YbhB/YbcL family protein